MLWIYKCPSCEAEVIDEGEHLCISCRKPMRKWRTIDEEYVKDMVNRSYWLHRKKLEQERERGDITTDEYEKKRRWLERHLHHYKGGQQLLIDPDKPLINPYPGLGKG